MPGEESTDVSLPASAAIKSYSDGPPWTFRGRALYQLHAVKTSVARRFVPPELKLVEAFGYTLGGLFLASYDSSPAGQFDEAVVIAGIVWNAPTSCAWAGRVLVGSEEARIHGRQEVGLPSHLASFSHQVTQLDPPNQRTRPWWDARAWFSTGARNRARKLQHSVKIMQRDGISAFPLCEIVRIPPVLTTGPSLSSPGNQQRWRGPSIQLYLPNFSGKTKDQPKLLKYSCALNCRVSVVAPARITDLTSSISTSTGERTEEDQDELRTRDVVNILLGKPLASIFFDGMEMRVEAPKVAVMGDSEKQRKQKLLKPAGDTDPAFGASASAS